MRTVIKKLFLLASCSFAHTHTMEINEQNRLRNFEEEVLIRQLLISHGAGINEQNEKGEMLLHTAVKRGTTISVKLLLKHNADMNLKDKNGYTPAHLALFYDDVECLKVLVEHGLNTNIIYTLKNSTGQWAQLTIAEWAQMFNEQELYALITGEELPKPWYEKYDGEQLGDMCIIL